MELLFLHSVNAHTLLYMNIQWTHPHTEGEMSVSQTHVQKMSLSDLKTHLKVVQCHLIQNVLKSDLGDNSAGGALDSCH